MAFTKKNYSYIDSAGLHFPDADAGDSTYYALDLACLVDLEQETINSVTWEVPTELTLVESNIVNGKEAHVKITSSIPGVFRIKAIIESIDVGRTSTNTHYIILKVI
jgi:hypothetical protein